MRDLIVIGAMFLVVAAVWIIAWIYLYYQENDNDRR